MESWVSGCPRAFVKDGVVGFVRASGRALAGDVEADRLLLLALRVLVRVIGDGLSLSRCGEASTFRMYGP